LLALENRLKRGVRLRAAKRRFPGQPSRKRSRRTRQSHRLKPAATLCVGRVRLDLAHMPSGWVVLERQGRTETGHESLVTAL